MYIIIYISFHIAMKVIKHSKTVFISSHVQNEALFTWTELLHEYIHCSLDNWRERVFYHTSCWTEMFIQFHSMCKMSTKDISIETVVTSNALHDLKTQPINSYSQIKQIPEHSSINIMNLIYTHIRFSLIPPFFVTYSGFLAAGWRCCQLQRWIWSHRLCFHLVVGCCRWTDCTNEIKTIIGNKFPVLQGMWYN